MLQTQEPVKKCISFKFIIVGLKSVPQLSVYTESNIIHTLFGGPTYCKNILLTNASEKEVQVTRLSLTQSPQQHDSVEFTPRCQS